MPLRDSEFDDKLGKALDFLGGLLAHPEHVDELPAEVDVDALPSVVGLWRLLVTPAGAFRRFRLSTVDTTTTSIVLQADVPSAPWTGVPGLTVRCGVFSSTEREPTRNVEVRPPFYRAGEQTGARRKEQIA